MGKIAIKSRTKILALCFAGGGLLVACGGGDVQEAPTKQTQLLANGEACNSPWVSSTAYVGGNKVSYNGVNYTANWWTQGNNPSTSNGPTGSGQPWTAGYTCGGGTTTTTKAATTTTKAATTTTTKAVTTTTGSSCNYINWATGQNYAVGTVVKYLPNGNFYREVNAGTNGSDGTDPTISTWYWSPTTCSGGTSTTTATTTTTTASGTGLVCFYQDINFQGNSYCVNEGSANTPTGWNDAASSVKVRSGYRAELFVDGGLQGGVLTITADEPNLVNRGFNDLMSSYRVSKYTPPVGFKTLDYLYSITGTRTLSGQHNDQKDDANGPTGVATYTNRVRDITGVTPGLWSGDFLFHGNSGMRWDVVYEAERQWNAGAVVNIMWHACSPNRGAVCDWWNGVRTAYDGAPRLLNDQEWNDLVTNGGWLNGIWKSRMDEIAVYLQYLEDKKVEVMWRPLHEMNQGVFWWAGRHGANGSRRLYQLTHDYLVNVKGLTNLIWVWDVQDIDSDYNYAEYNPGNGYWDVAALDIYGSGYTDSRYYNALVAQAGGKPVGFGECFKLPSASVLLNNPRMSFFMNWSYGLQEANTNQEIKDVYYNPRVIKREDMPGWR